MKTSERRKTRFDRKGLGAIGGVLILVLVVIGAAVAASVVTPYVMKQELKVGDYFVYDSYVSQDIVGLSQELRTTQTIKVIKVEGDEITFEVTVEANYHKYNGVVKTPEELASFQYEEQETVKLRYEGNVLFLDYEFGSVLPFFIIDLSDLSGDMDKSTSYFLFGLVPLLVDKYELSDGEGYEMTVLMKSGTNLLMSGQGSSEIHSSSMELKDTNVRWAKLF